MLWIMCQVIPILRFMMMDWVAWFMAIGGIFILLFVFGMSGTGLQYDTIPPGTAVINYIRRDGNIAPLLGKRIFVGESFLDVPKLGLVEDLGKDTVFLWGRKKVRFGLENINYTPDPRYFNMCHCLYQLGFDDSNDLREILYNIPNMDSTTDKARKAYYLERMGIIYWNMTHEQPRSVSKLMDVFKKKRDNIKFGTPREQRPKQVTIQKPKERTTEDIHQEVDKWLK